MKIFCVLFLIAFAAVRASNEEGDTCSIEGEVAVCTKLSRCPAAKEDIRNRRSPQICKYDGAELIVCCKEPVSATLTTTKRPPTTTTTEYNPPSYDYYEYVERTDGCGAIPPALTANKTGQKAWDKCVDYQDQLVFPCAKTMSLAGGYSRSNRCHHNADQLILGGTDAGMYEFSHMALLGYGDDVTYLLWRCGGSLISEKFILTAGHCTYSGAMGPVTYVALGMLKRRDAISSQNLFKVKEIIKHPEYKPPITYHDIALLELEKTVALSEFLVPACLHTGDVIDDSHASASGWGYTNTRQTTSSDKLQKVVLTKFNTTECANEFTPHRLRAIGFDEETQICYGDRTQSKDTCQGDSGGPLQVKSKIIACMYTIIGVTSNGRSCGLRDHPGLYTKVAHYLDWIEKTVWP